MSHFPGTERYAEPDLAFDKELLAGMAAARARRPRRGGARPHRQCRTALLGLRRRRAWRAQARPRLAGAELAPQLRLARLVCAAAARAAAALSGDSGRSRRADPRAARARP